MKTQLHHLLVLICTLALSVTGYSQLAYTQNFNDFNQGNWGYGFSTYNSNGCGETTSLRGNFYYYYSDWDGEYYDNPATTVSPALGLSNGQLATMTYNYKIVEYSDNTLATPNSPSWGTVELQWGTSDTGPWTTFQTISPSNHLESNDCAAKTATFTPPAGSQVYVRVNAATGQNLTDVNLYIDDISITQPLLACSGTPPAATAATTKGYACNTENFTLSFFPGTTSSGITYQWQSSPDNVTYTNISGATTAGYTASQSATTWYRVIITCTASTLSTTSTPVKVINSGTACYCKDIEFLNGVEPITLVNFAGINNISSASLDNDDQHLQDFTYLTPGQANTGQSYPVIIQGNTGGNYMTSFKVYIDFNHNGLLNDPGEGFDLGYLENSSGDDGAQLTGNIAIPSSALTGFTLMRVAKQYIYEDMEIDEYLPTTCGSDENTGYGQVEDYLLNIQLCSTVAPVADADQAFCSGGTLSDIAVTGTSVKWYAAETGGTALGANVALVSGTTYYASSTSGCESATRIPVTVTINNPAADSPDDVISCGSYILPELTNGSYFSEAGGLGDPIMAGDEITEDATLYVYNTVGTCSAENSFTVTITSLEVDQLDDTTVCSEYILPELTSGTYYTGGSGLGDQLEAGDAITETMTIHIYGASDVNPACTAETTFTVTVISVEADEMDDVDVCSTYVLPALSAGNNYYTETGGQGSALVPGSVIAASQTIYIYTMGGPSMQCSDETSFTVTVADIDAPIVEVEILYELDLTGGLFLNQVEVEAEGTLTWYANEEDAQNGVNPISSDTVVPAGTTTYYVTQTVGECESEPAEVTITVVVLDAKEFDMAAFSYYPNPVNDLLNISYSENITGVEVLNLVGQRVMSAEYNQDKVQLNLSQLASGTYLIRVSTENASKTIKVVKNR